MTAFPQPVMVVEHDARYDPSAGADLVVRSEAPRIFSNPEEIAAAFRLTAPLGGQQIDRIVDLAAQGPVHVGVDPYGQDVRGVTELMVDGDALRLQYAIASARDDI